jgi:hypothetical protein
LAIARMISRDIAEFRAFQTRNTEVGRVRIGQFTTPEGKRGRPVKLDRFRLTSPTEDHIRVAAAEYGGEPRLYQPQGGGAQQWEVITETNALDVWIVNRQNIDPVYEMWGAGRTCTRRCDGEWNTVLQEPCLCNDPERRPADPRQLCKITTRVNVMLPKVAGLHAWRFETHSENAAVEMAAPAVAGVVRIAPVPVPSTLRLRREQRRERNHEKGTFETKDFYVPWFDLSRIGAQALAGGEEALRVALTGAGAPELLADQRQAIGAAPVSAVPASAPPAEPELEPEPEGISDGLRAKILADIEAQTTAGALLGIKAKLQARGIDDKDVKDAWRSKLNAIEAAAKAVPDGEEPSTEEPEYAVGDTVTVGGVEFTKISDGATIEEVFGREPLATPDPGLAPDDPWAEKIEAGVQAEMAHAERAEAIEGTVEGDGTGLPMIPDGPYEFNAELPKLMVLAGQRTPPLTTDGLRDVIKATFELPKASDASGYQLAQLAEAMRQGLV